MSDRARRALAVVVALTIAPHMFFIPLWLALPCLTLAIACAYSPPPPLPKIWRFALFVVLVSSLAMIALYFRRIWGREPGISLLTVMVAAKLLEVRSSRDAMVLWCASAVLLVALTTFDQEMLALAYLLTVLVVLFTLLDVIHDAHDAHSIRAHTRQAMKRLLLGVPIALVLFVLFPRMSAPPWGFAESRTGKTGLSETMQPGLISKLVRSDEVAFRVEFPHGQPARDQLYWRGPVLDQFHVEGDTESWSTSYPGPGQFIPLPMGEGSAHTLEYAVTLQPHFQRWVFALDLPASYPRGSRLESTTNLTRAQQLLHRFPIREPIRYEIASTLTASYPADVADIHRNLHSGPGSLNPRARQWAAELFARVGRDRQAYVKAVLAHIRQEPYRYTTQPPALRRNMVDDFWFNTRQGFCEHYAGAFVFLMRTVGVPARVVTGYQGGELNAQNNVLVVRQSDAHAWAEVILDGRWTRIDPTAAVAPQRIELDLSAALPASERSAFRRRDSLLINFIRDSWDAVHHTYTAWLLGYDRSQQLRALSWLGMDGFAPAQWIGAMLLFLVAAVLMTIALYTWRERAARRKGNGFEEALWYTFLRKVRAMGLARRVDVTPRSVWAEISARVPTAQLTAMQQFLHKLEQARYGAEPPVPERRQQRRELLRAYRAVEFRTLARALRTLRAT